MQLPSAIRLSIPILAVMLFYSSVTAQQPAPQDKPVLTAAEKQKKFDDAIAPYVKQARDTLPGAKARFLAGLKHGEAFFVTIRVYDDPKRFEQVFVQVTGWEGDTIKGILASDLEIVKTHRKGELITCKKEDVYDWTISKPDGTDEGNFVGKFLDSYEP
jgi:uncharacterized protein YegJ (DUF2314 family)